MVFSSATFLFLFLPFSVLLYFICLQLGIRAANILLLTISLLFYAWGEGVYTVIFVFSMFINWIFGLILDSSTRYRKPVFILGIAANLILLSFFKYAGFLYQLSMQLTGKSSIDSGFEVHLPLGISFFTFHAISYLFDIYRRTTASEKDFTTVGLYLALYPQLIAGPIVRFKQIASQLHSRTHSSEQMQQGIMRFVLGLAKKMLIANELGRFADLAFATDPHSISTLYAWIGLISYGLQIYFDFSGYSDMAIGIALIFGFRFPENFNLPYISQNIREFWQRWHITLSLWFRDYLYIPLGGNRLGEIKTARNLCLVFLLCGLWHGASWNFIAWGLLHGFFLSIERFAPGRLINSCPRLLRHIYTLAIVFLLWVLFRSDNLNQAISYWSNLFSINSVHNPAIAMQITHRFQFIIILSIFLSAGLGWKLWNKLPGLAQQLLCFALLFISTLELAKASYNPFIYFRF